MCQMDVSTTALLCTLKSIVWSLLLHPRADPKTVLVITETDPSDVLMRSLILPLMMVLSGPREKTYFDSVIVRAHRGLGGHRGQARGVDDQGRHLLHSAS